MTDTPQYTYSQKHTNQHSPHAKLLVYKLLAIPAGATVFALIQNAIPLPWIIAIAILVALTFVLLYRRKCTHIATLFETGTFVTAEITDITYQRFMRWADTPQVHVRYFIPAQWIETALPATFAWTDDYHDDTEVDLVVNPEKPEECYIAELYGEPDDD